MWRILTALVLGCYIILWWQFPHMPYHDLPNHTVRSFFIGNLLKDSHGSEFFRFEPYFQPYILGDLIFAALLQIMSVENGAMAWMTLGFLSLPLGVLFFAKETCLKEDQKTFLLLCSMYLATNWFFLSAYANYSLGIGLVFVTVALWSRWIQSARILHYFLFILSIFTCYLLHLAPYFFCSIIIFCAVSYRLLTKQIATWRWFLSLFPLGALGIFYLATKHFSAQPQPEQWIFRPLLEKPVQIGSMFLRFNYTFDLALFVFFVAIFLLLLVRRADTRDHALREYGVIIVSLLAAYLILPVSVGLVADIDGRALPLLFLFFSLFVVTWAKTTLEKTKLFHAMIFVLAITNLFYLGRYLSKHDRYLIDYLHALDTIPPQQTVLPIATKHDEGRIQTALHIGELYMIRQGGLTPYVFSKNTSKDQFRYFYYTNQPYMPFLFWYSRKIPVDWDLVEKGYNYIIITKPFSRERIGLTNLERTFENDAAVVFRILK